MATLVPVRFDKGTTIYVESAESAIVPGRPTPIEEAGVEDVAQKALVVAQELTGSIKDFCEHAIISFRELNDDTRPTRATIAFGLNVSAEGNVYVVKGIGAASINITAEWEWQHQDMPSE